MPTPGEIVLFDRSWYNRAGVERVMGFCTQDQLADFLREAPQFEGMLVRDGVHLFKFYLDIGREMQWKRFHDRRHDPLRSWKITEIDRAAVGKWGDYTKAKEELFRFTHTATTPWTVIRANDKRRARVEVIRTVLATLDYEGKSKKTVGTPDPSDRRLRTRVLLRGLSTACPSSRALCPGSIHQLAPALADRW